jgi:hypothetical protein
MPHRLGLAFLSIVGFGCIATVDSADPTSSTDPSVTEPTDWIGEPGAISSDQLGSAAGSAGSGDMLEAYGSDGSGAGEITDDGISTDEDDESQAVEETPACGSGSAVTADATSNTANCAPAQKVICYLRNEYNAGTKATSATSWWPSQSLIRIQPWNGQGTVPLSVTANNNNGPKSQVDLKVTHSCATHISPQTGLAYCEANVQRIQDGTFFIWNRTVSRTVHTSESDTKWMYLDGTGTELVKFKSGTIFAAATSSLFTGWSIGFMYGPVGISMNLGGAETGSVNFVHEDACQVYPE